MKLVSVLLSVCIGIAVSSIYLFFRSYPLSLPLFANTIKTTNPIQNTEKNSSDVTVGVNPNTSGIKMLKDVGEAYMDHFGLTETDFKRMQDGGINVIEGNFDICAIDTDVKYFLDQSQKHNIRVVLNAGAGEAEWGYACDEDPYPTMQEPEWQSEKVVTWVKKWKDHPALYAWDTSNEAGSVFPNASWRNDQNTPIPSAFYLDAGQLQTAYRDVKAADPDHPVMIRMNGWFFYDNDHDFFREGNPFAKGVADIVMINVYSNVEDYYSDFVTTVMTRAISSTQKIDPHVTYIASLGIWNEPPLWRLPTDKQFENDLRQISELNTPVGLSFFKYGAEDSEWYLPTDAPYLWSAIANVK
jgi:hypothetical protein